MYLDRTAIAAEDNELPMNKKHNFLNISPGK